MHFEHDDECCSTYLPYAVCFISGWGDTGVQDTSTDKLQEIEVPIVPSSNCLENINQTAVEDADLIVCTGGLGVGPCKVSHR